MHDSLYLPLGAAFSKPSLRLEGGSRRSLNGPPQPRSGPPLVKTGAMICSHSHPIRVQAPVGCHNCATTVPKESSAVTLSPQRCAARCCNAASAAAVATNASGNRQSSKLQRWHGHQCGHLDYHQRVHWNRLLGSMLRARTPGPPLLGLLAPGPT